MVYEHVIFPILHNDLEVKLELRDDPTGYSPNITNIVDFKNNVRLIDGEREMASHKVMFEHF